MTDWIEFHRILCIASGSDSLCVPPEVAMSLDDAQLNRAARRQNMLPLPGGKGDVGMSELAENWIKESAG